MKGIPLLLLFCLIQTATLTAQTEPLVFYRIESIIQLKKTVMHKIWPETSDAAFDIPFILYFKDACYVINPEEKFLKKYNPEFRYSNGNLKVYKTSYRIDDIPFHMEVRISDDSTEFNSNIPYGKVSSYEETLPFAPHLTAEMWSGMTLHELFHGYQFRHPQFWKHASDSKLIYSVINDSLQSYYENFDWYKTSIDRENNLVLKAIEEKDITKAKELAREMLILRDARRNLAVEKINRPVAFYEPAFETMEGTARYIEEEIIAKFQTVRYPLSIQNLDSAYKMNKGQKPILSEMAYKTEISQRYTYAVGFNMARLLDRLKVEYKTRLFDIPELTLEKILRDYLKIKP